MKTATTRLCLLLIAAAALTGCGIFPRWTLTLTVEPTAGGVASFDPAKTKYRSGEEVTLTATAASSDYSFSGYYDADGLISSVATTVVTMDADKEITAVFRIEGVTTGVTPTGSGTVSVDVVSSPRGYYSGSVLRFTATPATGYRFVSWSDDIAGTDNPVEVTVTAPLTATATFSAQAVDVTITDTYTGPGNESFLVDTTTAANLEYTLDLGSSAADVYFVLTNTGTAAAGYPGITEVSGSFGARVAAPLVRPAIAPPRPVAIRGNPLADAFYKEAAKLRKSAPPGASRRTAPEPRFDDIGDAVTFYYASTNLADQIPAQCKAKVVDSDAGVTLFVYVADADFGSGGTKVDQTMVNALAAKFLKTSSTDDIYAWDTTIFGVEWDSTGLDSSVDISDNNTITILLYDIERDGATNPPAGGIAGFFWAKDNYLRSAYGGAYDYSNQRLMFYLDAPMLAYVESALGESSWAITNVWPEEIIATLAHEFQHMIHYYQKDVKLGASDLDGSGTWANEMCSMVAEDFVSDKLEVKGPRGVDPATYTDGSAGAAGNTDGYLPYFIYENTTPVAYWPASGSGAIANYAAVYAFGAYLARNLGGSPLFRDIVQNAYIGRDSVTHGLSLAGQSDDFASALRKFGVANLLSDDISAPAGYVYNTGGWMAADIDGTHPYQLGSINLFNYDYSSQSGPTIATQLPTGTQAGSSSLFYQAGAGATGSLVWDISLAAETRLEVVVKP